MQIIKVQTNQLDRLYNNQHQIRIVQMQLQIHKWVNKNNFLGKTLAYDGVTLLDQNANADPCGLIAKSLFNDTFTPIKLNNNIFEIRYI